MKLNFDLKTLFKRKGADAESIPEDLEGAPKRDSQLKGIAIWVKAHMLLVILALVSAASVAGALLYSGEMVAEIESSAGDHKSKLDKLRQLESTSVTITIPGNAPITQSAVVTRKLVDAVKERMGEGGSDSGAMRKSAVEHNKGSHSQVVNLRVPSSDPRSQEIHLDFMTELRKRYEELVSTELSGNAPLAEEDVMVKLQRSRAKFVQSDLKKAPTATLTPAEAEQLTSYLKQQRVGLYADSAEGCRVYLVAEDIGIPKQGSESALKRRPAAMWDLQQRLWVVEDILRACNSVNKNESVIKNPIKRIISIDRPRSVAAAAVATEGEGDTMGGEGGGGSGDGSSSDGNAAGDVTAAAEGEGGAPPINPSQIVPINSYAASGVVKGWATNQLYDVFRTRVVMIAQTDAIPQIADALARQNFIAVTDVRIVPTDAYAGLADGYFYGPDPIVKVTFTLDSAWLREWTGPLMPDEVRKRLGTSGQLAGVTPDASPAAGQEN